MLFPGCWGQERRGGKAAERRNVVSKAPVAQSEGGLGQGAMGSARSECCQHGAGEGRIGGTSVGPQLCH